MLTGPPLDVDEGWSPGWALALGMVWMLPLVPVLTQLAEWGPMRGRPVLMALASLGVVAFYLQISLGLAAVAFSLAAAFDRSRDS